MANVQSPPGLLNVRELLIVMGMKEFQIPVERMGLMEKKKNKNVKGGFYLSYKMFDVRDLDAWETRLNKKYIISMNFIVIDLNIYPDGSHEVLEIRPKKYYKFDFRQDYIYVLKMMHNLRHLLSTKQLDAYIMHNYTYQKVPPEFWHDDWNWYRLLADCSLYGNIPSIGDAYGPVYFKKEDVDLCLFADFNEQQDNLCHSSLINLGIYTTPWLQVLGAIYDEYGKDKLALVSKASVESFIGNYIKKHELDISISDIPFLAKFMRLAEQKEGKKYHAKQKFQKLNT